MNLLSVIVSTVEYACQTTDQDMAKIEKVCHRGCDTCCYQITSVNSWEELKIIEYIHKRLDSETKSILKKNLESWFVLFNNVTREASHTSPLTPEEMNNVENIFLNQGVPCPLLIEKVCAIYEVRPLACRVHIETSDPANCRNNPHRVTTPEAQLVYKKSMKVFDPHIFTVLSKPLPYAVAGELKPKVSVAKPFLGMGVDLRKNEG